LTIPFHKYAGPGTNVIDNLIKGVVPTDYNDELSMYHDIEYLKNSETTGADSIMIRDTSNDLEGVLTAGVLGLKVLADSIAHKAGGSLHLSAEDRITQRQYEFLRIQADLLAAQRRFNKLLP